MNHPIRFQKEGLTVATLQELIAQKEALERQIEQTRQRDRSDAVAKVRALMDQYGLSLADLSSKGGAKARAGKGNKVAAKYRNAATGDSWSGRGLQPKWLKAALASGRKLGDFAV
ncbi:MAG: H-NS histone family protein [Burkholderiales bacterium]